MENAIIKRDSVIQGLKKKLEKLNDLENTTPIEREVYVVEPSIAVNHINDQLCMYKDIYEALSVQNRETVENVIKLELNLEYLENENLRLKSLLKAKNNNDGEGNIKKKFDINNFICPTVDVEKVKDKLNIHSEQYYSTPIQPSVNIKMNFIESEEWNEIMKYSGLTQEDLNRLAKNKSYAKYVEAFEMLNRLLCDKSHQIRLLQTENENLNEKNTVLNKENSLIIQQCTELRNQLDKEKNEKQKKKNKENPENTSMVYRLFLFSTDQQHQQNSNK
jgi:hypothetical protein